MAEIPLGGVVRADSSLGLKTGSWRSGQRPLIDFKKCKHCFICFHFCPEGAINGDGEKIFGIDYDYCKGCGICAKECPFGALVMKEEK